jgi:hypothetical protein
MKTLPSRVCAVGMIDNWDDVLAKRKTNYHVNLEGTELETSGQKRLQFRAETLSDEDLCYLIVITTVLFFGASTFPVQYVSDTSFCITGRTATKQSLTEGETANPKLGQMAECEGQMPNEQDTITKAYTWALCDRGIYSPGLSEMGMYHHISVYWGT